MYEIFKLDKQVEKFPWYQKLRYKFGNRNKEKAKMVLVEGNPGIGKTTFCIKIASDWAKKVIPKKHDFPVFQLMFLLKCQDIDGDVMQAIDDQLLPEDMPEKRKRKLMDFIRDEKNQEKILIILDGLDELPRKAEPFVDKLLRRKVLSHCSILATSREEKGIDVRQRYDFDCLLQVNGFITRESSDFVRKYFKNPPNDPRNGERLIQAIEKQSFLHALRNNPLNLLLLCIVFQDYDGELPSSRTKLYQIIYRCLQRRFCCKNDGKDHFRFGPSEEQFENVTLALGELAWKGLREDLHSFHEHQFDQLEELGANIDRTLASKSGLVFKVASAKKLDPRHQYHFLHKTFQEFLAAKYLVHKMLEEGKNIFDHFELDSKDVCGKYRQVFLFVAGILDQDGGMFFKQMGRILQESWKWHSSNQNGIFLNELLNESGASDNMALAACLQIGLPKHLELNCNDWLSLRVVRYVHEGSSLQRNAAPLQLTKLNLSEAHTLSEHSAIDLHRILDTSKELEDLSISANEMTSLLANTLLKGLSSNSSLSVFTLQTSKSILPDAAVTFGKSLSSSKSLTAVTLKLFNERSESWASAVDSGLSAATPLKSVNLEIYGLLGNSAVEAFKSLLSNTSLETLSLIVYGNMQDSLAAALTKGLLGETSLRSLTVVVHGRLTNAAANSLEESVLEKRTLLSLGLQVHGEVPESWMTVTGNILSSQKSWQSLLIHPYLFGQFADSPVWLYPISGAAALEHSLTINVWGEWSIRDAEGVRDNLLNCSSLSNLTLNVYGKVSNGVADCLVKFFKANKVPFPLTINLHGKMTSSALRRFREESHLQPFTLNVRDDLATEDSPTSISVDISNEIPDKMISVVKSKQVTDLSVTVSLDNDTNESWVDKTRDILAESSSLSKFSLTVHNCAGRSDAWGKRLGTGLVRSKSLTTFSLAVHNGAEEWEEGLATGLAVSTSLTTFSLTVNNHADRNDTWEYSLPMSLAMSKSLTTFSLTVHNYGDLSERWGRGLGENLAGSVSLTEFSFTVHNYTDLSEGWGCGLGEGLAKIKSLTTFNLTVHNYADMSDGWGSGLGKGLAKNSSLTTFSLTVQDDSDTSGEWGYGLGNCLAKSKSLTQFSLAVLNCADISGEWGHRVGDGLAKVTSLTVFSLTVHNYTGANEDWVCRVCECLSNVSSLTRFNLTVHNYENVSEGWGYRVGVDLSKITSLTTFSLVVHNYTGASENWVYGLGEGVAKMSSLETFSLEINSYAYTATDWEHTLADSLAKSASIATIHLAINNHSKSIGDLGYVMWRRLADVKSLKSLSVSVSLYGENVC